MGVVKPYSKTWEIGISLTQQTETPSKKMTHRHICIDTTTPIVLTGVNNITLFYKSSLENIRMHQNCLGKAYWTHCYEGEG